MAGARAKNRSRRWLVLLLRGLAHVPLPILYLIADALFLFLYHVLRLQRALTLDNVRHAFPALAPSAQRRIAARSYHNALHVLFETIKAQTLGADQLAERVVMENPELIHDLLRQHPTLVVAGAHQGNWEWMQLACSAQLKVRMATLYKPLSHDDLDALLRNLRGRFGGLLIEAGGSPAGLIRFARAGGLLALLADQGPRPDEEQYWSRFLDRDTAFYPGVEKLTRLLHAPLLFACLRRTGRGRYRLRLEVLAAAGEEAPANSIMERYVRRLESQVRSAPEDWLWVYKRWKYRRPDPM